MTASGQKAEKAQREQMISALPPNLLQNFSAGRETTF
jgi:hypothetical protein